ncbi:MAG: hypothetical protein H0T69_17395 [Thermoleophilaceae bacterium]|nr:hypothetical protein [Thermoleophilaceae bacterium]
MPSLRPAAAGRRALIARLGALLLLSLAVLSAGCGADEESSAEPPPKAPELTIPETDTEEQAPQTETPTTETTPPSTDGGTPTPEPAPEAPTDTPENDTPPPTDSPAERFEDFCNDNPGACG